MSNENQFDVDEKDWQKLFQAYFDDPGSYFPMNFNGKEVLRVGLIGETQGYVFNDNQTNFTIRSYQIKLPKGEEKILVLFIHPDGKRYTWEEVLSGKCWEP